MTGRVAAPSFAPVHRNILFLLILSVAAADVAWAQMPADPDPPATSRLDRTAKRKAPSWFLRPKQATPAEQLEWAQRLRDEDRLRAAARACRALVHAWHNAPEAATAQQVLAEIQEDRRKYTAAFDEYQYLVEQYNRGFVYDEVLDRQFRIAHLLMTDRVGRVWPFPGFEAPERALPLFQSIVRNAPGGQRGDAAQFNVGRIHELRKDYEAAATAYEVLFYRYGSSAYAEDAAIRRVECFYALALQRRNDDRSAQDTILAASQFLRRHPASPHATLAQTRIAQMRTRLADKHFDVARFYDRPHGGSERAARVAYEDFLRRFPDAEAAPTARARVAELAAREKP